MKCEKKEKRSTLNKENVVKEKEEKETHIFIEMIYT